MPDVADFIDRCASIVAERFGEEASRLESARGLERGEVISELPLCLRMVAAAIRGEVQGGVFDGFEEAHLRSRLRLGYSLEDVREEYSIVGRLLLQIREEVPLDQRPPPEALEVVLSSLERSKELARTVFGTVSLADHQRERRVLRQLDALAWKTLLDPSKGSPVEPLLEFIRADLEASGVLLSLQGDGADASLRPVAAARWRVDSDAAHRFRPGDDTFLGRVAAMESSVRLCAAQQAEVVLPRAAVEAQADTLLGVRLSAHGRVLGVLLAGSSAPDAFPLRVQLRFESLAEQLARLLERADLLARQHREELRYQFATRATSDLVWDLDLLANTVEWGEVLPQLFGYTVSELGNDLDDWSRLIHPEDRERVEDSLQAAIDGTADRWRDEYRFRHQAGHYVVVTDVGFVERDPSGRAVRMVGAMKDVTEERRAAEALRLSEERLRLALEAARQGTWEYHPLSGAVVTDRRCKEMFGHPGDQGASIDSLLDTAHPEDRALLVESIARSRSPDPLAQIDFEFRIIRPDNGQVRWIHAVGRAFRDERGQIRYLGTVRNRTALKMAQEELLRSEEAYRTLAESLPQAIWASSSSGELEYANQTLVRNLGLGLDEARQVGWDYFCHPDDLSETTRRRQQALERGEPAHIEHRLRISDGSYRWFLTIIVPQKDAEGRVVRWFGSSTDIDDLRRALAELSQRSEFEQQLIGIVSHDLRNPVAAIITGCQSLLRRESLNQSQAASVARMLGAADRVRRMITDLLDFTQARLQGRLPINPSRTDVHAIAHAVVEEVMLAQSEGFVELSIDGDGWGEWDADRLAQMLMNLVTNALAYGASSEAVKVETRGGEDEVVITVRNKGAPIPEDILPRIFQPLERGAHRKSGSRSIGLGLFIVSEVVRAHGGSVAVTSSEDETCFAVHLPRRPPGPER